MTDLLTPADLDPSGINPSDEELPRRTFRAATLDDAVAAARAELGPDVELVEAHRVRRGGLGGFFATDLGVEIVATPRPAPPSPPSTRSFTAAPMPTVTTRPSLVVPTEIDDQEIPPILPVTPASAEVVTALDRLIEHAESIDRAIPVEHSARTPLPSLTDEIDPLWRTDVDVRPDLDPTSFEAHLRTELASTEDRSSETATLSSGVANSVGIDTGDALRPDMLRRSTTDEMLTSDRLRPTDELLRPDLDCVSRETTIEERGVETSAVLSTDAEEDALGDPPTTSDRLTGTATDVADVDTTETTAGPEADPVDADDARASVATLAPPSPLLNPSLRDDSGSIEEIDALLRDVGIDIDDADVVDADLVDVPDEPTSIDAITPIPTEAATIDEAASVVTDRVVQGILELQRQSTQPVRRFSVTVAMPDGTTIGLSTDLGECDAAHVALTPSTDVVSTVDRPASDGATVRSSPDLGDPDGEPMELSIGESVLLARLLDGTFGLGAPMRADDLVTDTDDTDTDTETNTETETVDTDTRSDAIGGEDGGSDTWCDDDLTEADDA